MMMLHWPSWALFTVEHSTRCRSSDTRHLLMEMCHSSFDVCSMYSSMLSAILFITFWWHWWYVTFDHFICIAIWYWLCYWKYKYHLFTIVLYLSDAYLKFVLLFVCCCIDDIHCCSFIHLLFVCSVVLLLSRVSTTILCHSFDHYSWCRWSITDLLMVFLTMRIHDASLCGLACLFSEKCIKCTSVRNLASSRPHRALRLVMRWQMTLVQ